MDTTAAKFDQANDSLNSMLSRLMNELEALRAGWQGSGGRSFEAVKQAYDANQRKLSAALSETAGAIRTSGATYTSTDQESSSRVNNISTDVQLPL